MFQALRTRNWFVGEYDIFVHKSTILFSSVADNLTATATVTCVSSPTWVLIRLYMISREKRLNSVLLDTTTDILRNHPELAAKCSVPFKPASAGSPATAKCCTTDFTLAEFKTLCGKMDGVPNPNATSVANYLTTPNYRTDL